MPGRGRMSIVEGECKECLPSQQAQQLLAGILVKKKKRGIQDWEWGQQLKGDERAFPSFELQTPGCSHRPLKNGDMEGFWESLKFPLNSPHKEPPKIAFLKRLCCLAPHRISNLGPPTSSAHKVFHWNLSGVQEKYPPDKEESEETEASSLFLVFDSAA